MALTIHPHIENGELAACIECGPIDTRTGNFDTARKNPAAIFRRFRGAKPSL